MSRRTFPSPASPLGAPSVSLSLKAKNPPRRIPFLTPILMASDTMNLSPGQVPLSNGQESQIFCIPTLFLFPPYDLFSKDKEHRGFSPLQESR